MAVHIVEEAARCLGCKKPACQLKGCPVSTPIPRVIDLFNERKIEEAGKLLFDNNPLSAVCAIVCNHSEQCEGLCIRNKMDTPVHFSSIESYISHAYIERFKPQPVEPNGKHVAIIGSGPAGITAAIKLAERGCQVTVFEQHSKIGGVLQYGIPQFRLPKDLVQRYRSVLCSYGVQVRPSITIGDSLHIEDLLEDGYDSIFIGTGTWRAKKLGIPGETRGRVYFGIDYLMDPASCPIGDRVAVIGVGNTAMDVARTAIRQGAKEVSLYARSKRVSASSDELEYALLDGAEIYYGKAIEGISEEGPYFKTAIFDEEDKVVGYEEELDYRKADATIIAVSQAPRDRLTTSSKSLESNENGLLIVDDEYMTTMPGVFAAGDVVHGAKTVVHAVAETKKAVYGMLVYMGLMSKEEAQAEQEAHALAMLPEKKPRKPKSQESQA